VVFLHGGPGAGCSPRHRRFFNPRHYRILLMDQRGAGRSRPLGEIIDNTPAHLVADLEQLRAVRGVAAWHVFGGSWGSTLGLFYAQTHPQACLSLTLRGIFLMRDQEVRWFFEGIRLFAPESWQAFHDFLPTELRADLAAGYWQQLNHPDLQVQLAAARAWSNFETQTLSARKDVTPGNADDPHAVLALARLEAHYMRSNRFMPHDRLLREVGRIRHIPAAIVHGRYDLLCPPANAFDLHQVWPEAELRIIENAGHSSWEPAIQSALIEIMDRRMAKS